MIKCAPGHYSIYPTNELFISELEDELDNFMSLNNLSFQYEFEIIADHPVPPEDKWNVNFKPVEVMKNSRTCWYLMDKHDADVLVLMYNSKDLVGSSRLFGVAGDSSPGVNMFAADSLLSLHNHTFVHELSHLAYCAHAFYPRKIGAQVTDAFSHTDWGKSEMKIELTQYGLNPGYKNAGNFIFKQEGGYYFLSTLMGPTSLQHKHLIYLTTQDQSVLNGLPTSIPEALLNGKESIAIGYYERVLTEGQLDNLLNNMWYDNREVFETYLPELASFGESIDVISNQSEQKEKPIAGELTFHEEVYLSYYDSKFFELINANGGDIYNISDDDLYDYLTISNNYALSKLDPSKQLKDSIIPQPGGQFYILDSDNDLSHYEARGYGYDFGEEKKVFVSWEYNTQKRDWPNQDERGFYLSLEMKIWLEGQTVRIDDLGDVILFYKTVSLTGTEMLLSTTPTYIYNDLVNTDEVSGNISYGVTAHFEISTINKPIFHESFYIEEWFQNSPPSVIGIPSQIELVLGELFVQPYKVLDQETFELSMTSSPQGAILGESTIIWTPQHAGAYLFELQAIDRSFSSSHKEVTNYSFWVNVIDTTVSTPDPVDPFEPTTSGESFTISDQTVTDSKSVTHDADIIFENLIVSSSGVLVVDSETQIVLNPETTLSGEVTLQ